LSEQLDSIRDQQNVDVSIIVSDDQSSDDTLHVLQGFSELLRLTILPNESERFGGANGNFLRLIRDAEIGKAQYVALADQDDIWNGDKLARGIAKLSSDNADAYSSDVVAFWPDGTTRLVKKSFPQKRLDYLFGSPGPGCTFLFSRSIFLKIRLWVTENYRDLKNLWVHDWTLYAYVRSGGYSWVIDNVPTMRYRQHHLNEIGVNVGFKAMLRRVAVVRDGGYRKNIFIISDLTRSSPKCRNAIIRLNFIDRLWLIIHANDFRRSLLEVIALQILFLLMPATPI